MRPSVFSAVIFGFTSAFAVTAYANTAAPTAELPTSKSTPATPTTGPVPALPPAVGSSTTALTAASNSVASESTPSADAIERLKEQLRTELEAELRAHLQHEMDAAARDAASQKAAAREWEEEKWIEEVKPKLNFLEMDGYFRTRFDMFNRLDLGTYEPSAVPGVPGRGTSGFPVPTLYRPFDGDACVDGQPANFPGDTCLTTASDSSTILTTNMRLRLDPTLNISDDIRVRSTVDILDNLVLGSSPESLPGFANNPTLPLPLFAASQNPTQEGLNSIYDAIRVKRLWAEVMTPIGQLRFGRMPQQWGLGLLANDGNKLDQDFGDNSDQVMFATRIAGHYIVPTYSFSSSGPFGRGGGAGLGGDGSLAFYQAESGQRYNLDPKDDVHSFILVVAKRDKEEDIAETVRSGGVAFNYGVFAVYRTQQYDIPSYFTKPGGAAVVSNPVVSPDEYVRRDANAGIGSLWARFQWDKLRIEAEAVGVGGIINGTSTQSSETENPVLTTVDGPQPLMVLQGGAAVESSYKLLNDQFIIGLDGGIASGDDAFGFGLRPVINQAPRAGDFDGLQYGQCLEYAENGECARVDNDITNFRFDADYIVDLILFREILGTVTDAFYVKPHIGYNITDNLGARADLIYSQAVIPSSTPGQVSPLGVEVDLTGFYGTEDGFSFMAQYGFLLPLGGFAHYADVAEQFQQPQFAQTFQLFGGVQF